MIFDLLKWICEALNKREIDYLLTGSLAMNYYTTPRMTRDIGIILNIQLENADEFISIIPERFYYNKQSILDAVKRRSMFNIIDQETGYKIDFGILKFFPFHQQEFKRKILINDWGFDCWIATKEDLVISKLIWIQELQSDKQKEDIRNLLENTGMDLSYVNNWVKTLNLETFNLLQHE